MRASAMSKDGIDWLHFREIYGVTVYAWKRGAA